MAVRRDRQTEGIGMYEVPSLAQSTWAGPGRQSAPRTLSPHLQPAWEERRGGLLVMSTEQKCLDVAWSWLWQVCTCTCVVEKGNLNSAQMIRA